MFRLAEPQSPRPPVAPPAPPNGPGQGSEYDERATASEEINHVLMVVTPWVVSLLLHLGIVVIAFFVLWTTGPEQAEEEVIVPLANLSETPGAPLQRTTEQEIEQQTQQRQITESQTSTMSMEASVSSANDTLGGPGAAGMGESPFQPTISSSQQLSSEIYGVQGGNARKIVYVIDASGSMIAMFNFVIDELIRSIQKLSEEQQFTVIFYQGNNVIEVPSPHRGFKRATGDNKQAVMRWLDPANDNVNPRGNSNPVPAIQLALRYEPHLIFLLSDEITGQGAYAVDQMRLLDEIEQVNKSGTKISTLQFLNRDPLTKLGLEGTMQRIADQTGGKYKFIDSEEAGRLAEE